MKQDFGGDRRQPNRNRRHQSTASGLQEGDRRRRERRRGERREFFRVVYPPAAAPKVLNANFQIANICQNGMVLICKQRCQECTQPINLKSVFNLKVEFHDEEIVDVRVRIIRCEGHVESNENCYVGLVEGGITSERINKEQAYLLRHFPDFCRFVRASSVEHSDLASSSEHKYEKAANERVD